MFKPLLLAAILAATVLPAVQQAHAEGLSIDLMPGVSLRIGDQDNRGRYWDGYDWRDRDWWQGHQGRYLGDRSPRGYYWDGYRWRDRDYWRKYYYSRDGRYYKCDHHCDKHYWKKEKNTTMITIAIAGVATAMTTAINDNGRRNAGPHCFRLQHTADQQVTIQPHHHQHDQLAQVLHHGAVNHLPISARLPVKASSGTSASAMPKLSSTWLSTRMRVASIPSMMTINDGSMVTARRSHSGIWKCTNPCITTCPPAYPPRWKKDRRPPGSGQTRWRQLARAAVAASDRPRRDRRCRCGR